MSVRGPLAALAGIFLAAHLAFLPPTLEDIDSINFALGVRDFDVAQHQPHPPGSPVFVALGKLSTPLLEVLGVRGAAARGLAVWSAIAGALLLPLLFALFRVIDGDVRRAFWTAVLAALAPLAWFTALRPMSDMTGFFIAAAAQWLVLRSWISGAPPRSLIAGALLAGLAAGVRIQTAALTVPVLAAALVFAPPSVSLASRVQAVAAAVAGVLVWVVPLMIDTGGPTNYLNAFGTQAGEDLVGVVMLWTSPKVRVAAHAVVNAFVWPWGTLTLGAIVAGVAAIGTVISTFRSPRAVALVALLFAPYALLHLLLQETLTLRYALPILPAVAYFFVRAVQLARVSPFAEIAVVAAGLVFTLPAARGFAQGSPAMAAMSDALQSAFAPSASARPRRSLGGGGPGARLAGHAGMRRVFEWMAETDPRVTGAGSGSIAFLRAPHGFEWLTMVEEWRRAPETTIQFLANPRRTDYRVLIDPQARRVTPYRWPFVEWPLLGGARPGPVDRVEFKTPGWMLDRGWAVSPEVAGVTEVEGYGPHRRPSIAWVRARSASPTMMIGGRHLGEAGAPDARVVLELSGKRFDEFTVSPGFFFRSYDVPAALITGTGYLPLSASAEPASKQAPIRVGLEQFDLQPAGVPMIGAAEGWHEPEFNRTTGRSWRWTSEKATLWLRPVGRDVVLTLAGESPLRYFDAAPTLRLMAGATELGRLSPADDFKWEVSVPDAALIAAAGRVTLESDKWFSPSDRAGVPDRRHLAVRIYSYEVR